jgi:jouberin
LRLEFSSKGKYLAVACTTSQKSKTIIKIFDVTAGEQPKLILRGHYDLIHDMDWSQDDNYLVTASADGSAKVWDLRKKDNANDKERLNYTENDSIFFLQQLMHPSYVYGAKFFPDEQNN